jgi:demethylspheroidene O-methyltransferase
VPEVQTLKRLDLAKSPQQRGLSRPGWRHRMDARIDQWMTSPTFYRWAISNPLTRWVTRRRAAQLFDVMAGFVHSQVLLACVRLNVFELLRDQPRTLEQLAQHARMSAPAMQRLMQSAVAIRLIEMRGENSYGLGALGAPVAADPGLRLMIEHNAVLFDDMRDPLALLRDEMQPHMQAYWPYMNGDNPQGWEAEKVDRYSELMSASQRFVIEELLASYDFSVHRQVLDIGGGKGGWVLALAHKVPSLKLNLMDLPPVAALAAERMDKAGVSNRVTVHGGSFISNALPAGSDLVTLVRVAHDHPDAVVKALLSKIYQMLPSGGRLLLAEPMAQPPGEKPVGDAYFHFYLLAMGSGRLRSPEELRSLMLSAGFESVEQVSNPMPLHTRLLLAQKR